MELKLRQGPWESVFKGEFQGHETELLKNEGGFLLTVIYEKEAGRAVGMLLQVSLVFHAEGEVQGFLESLTSEAAVLSRHDSKGTTHFLALFSKPEYSKTSEETASAAVDAMIGKVEQRSGMLLDVAKAYELKLRPLQECSEGVKQAFFSQPLVVPMLQKAGEGAGPGEPAASGSGAVPHSTGTVDLGLTKGEKAVKEPLELFKRTLVEGEGKQALHFLHLIVEGALLSNTTAIIFDSENCFEGLCQPNRNTEELQAYKVDIVPVGFPVKGFKAGEKVKVNLNSVDIAGMLEEFGASKETVQLVEKGLERGSVKGNKGLIEALDSLDEETGEASFESERAKRVVRLLGVIYPGLFNGPNELQEIVKGWARNIGRASIIDVSAMDKRALGLLVNGFLNELLEFSKKQGKGMQSIVVLPEAERVFPRRGSRLSKGSVTALKELKAQGVGFAATTEKAIDLDREFVKLVGARAGIVKGNDAAVQLAGRKNYRVRMRPGLSTCTEAAEQEK